VDETGLREFMTRAYAVCQTVRQDSRNTLGAMPTALSGHGDLLAHGHSEQWPWHPSIQLRSSTRLPRLYRSRFVYRRREGA
jgi:hypothetical protein